MPTLGARPATSAEVERKVRGSAPQRDLALTGRVGEYGKAKIDGAARLAAPRQDLKARVTFDNVELTSFSPYAGKFVGYPITKGKLSLDLMYQISKQQLVGENKLLVDQLTFGDKTDSPDATTLPVRLAVGLYRQAGDHHDLLARAHVAQHSGKVTVSVCG